jgi:hypothetical protein
LLPDRAREFELGILREALDHSWRSRALVNGTRIAKPPLCPPSLAIFLRRFQAVEPRKDTIMSRLKTTLVALTLTVLGAGAQTAQADVVKGSTTVVSVQAYKDALYLTLAAGQAGVGCAGGAAFAIIPNTHPAFAQEVSTILAAFLSGRTVDVTLSGCAASPSGGDSLPLVKYFTVR